jgi:UDP-N-acetylmuramoyl-tripeptide--D-alanyl-D-alanine ligase
VTAFPFWTLSRVADALAGVSPRAATRARTGPPSDSFPRGDTQIARVWTDTRTISRGDLFVALKGESFDAHDFLDEAKGAGAAAVVVSDARLAAGIGVPVFEVEDTLAALGRLGRYRREAWNRPVIAVGGSNGKTSTKELIRAALSSRLDVHATTGNLNNQIGVPQTLLALDESADVAIVEVGTNMPGEIAILREMVRPDVAVITAIEEEHLEGFGDLAGVLREEASLLDGVELAIVPAHEIALVSEARKRAKKVSRAGVGEGDVAATSGVLISDGTGRLEVEGAVVRVPLRGAHNMRNAMLAVAVARACGLSAEDAARGIAALDPAAMPGMRSAVEKIREVILVNDAYNANPGSARAAIDLLKVVAGDHPRVIVLGTMRELGSHALQAHRDIAKAAVASGAVIVAGIGEFGPALRDVASGNPAVIIAKDVDDLWPVLEDRLPNDAAILLKASRGVKLERIVPFIREWAADPSPYRTA